MGEALAKHFETVSAHGLSNFAGAQSSWRRIFWLFFFVAATTAFIVHLSLLVNRYRGQPTNTEFVPGAVNFRFPSLVVCNPFPISYSWSNYMTMNLTREEMNRETQFWSSIFHRLSPTLAILKKLAEQGKPVEHFGKGINDFSVYIRLMWSTWSNLEIPRIQPPSIDQFILKASINDKDLDFNSFETISSQEYLKCYRFINSSLIKNPTDTLTIYFYMDSSQVSFNPGNAKFASVTYSGTAVNDKSSSVLLFFTDVDEYPGIDANQITASSGRHTKISISMMANEMINSERNPCRYEAKPVTFASPLTDTMSHTYNLDRSLCEAYEWALKYHSECSCVPLRYPIPDELKSNASRCMNVTRYPVSKMTENIKCMSQIQFDSKFDENIKSLCKGIDPCKRMTYEVHWSNALWPTGSLVNTFAEETIQEIYQQRKDNNRPVPAWENVLNVTDKETLTKMIRENIAKVEIRPKSKRSMMISESMAYPAMNIFSDIGGIFGLYLGMSLLSLLELMESIVLSINSSTKLSKSKESVSKADS